VVALFASALHGGLAWADGPDRGHVVLSVAGHAGPLELRPHGRGWSGAFQIQNAGPGSLRVLRVAVMDAAADIGLPRGLRVTLGEATPATLAPREIRDVLVSWDDLGPVRRAFAQVVVTSTDEERGEVAMSVLASTPTSIGWVGRHALSLLVVWPLALVAFAALFGGGGPWARTWLRRAAIGVFGLEWLLALWAYGEFVPSLGRPDGDDGFQLVDRRVISAAAGIEWHLGVDATSILLVVLVATLVLVAAAGIDAGTSSYLSLALLASGAIGAFVALDLVVLFAAWELASASVLVMAAAQRAEHPGAASESVAKGVAVGAVGLLAMLAALGAFVWASGPSFLVDGSHAAHTLSVPDLARTSFDGAKRIAGLPLGDAVWAMLLVALVCAPAATPLRGLLPDVMQDASAPAAAALGGIAIALGPYLLVRLAFPNLPRGAGWAAPVVVALGAFEMIQSAVRVVTRRDARSGLAQATIALAGACLCAVGASRWR